MLRKISLTAATIVVLSSVACTTFGPAADTGGQDVVEPADVPADSVPETIIPDGDQDAADVPDSGERDIAPEIIDTVEPFPDIPPIECASDLACQRTYDDLPLCWRAFCDKWLGICLIGPATDGETCDPDDLCVRNASCLAGACIGASVNCDDGNPCTDDSCKSSEGCLHVSNTAPCDDGNPCTADDTCINGSCRPGPNSCTCSGDEQCQEYDDGNPCNGIIRCLSQKCVIDRNGIPRCEGSQDPCLANTCNPETGECSLIPVNEGEHCDDDDECTVNDVCRAGICAGDLGQCDDGNPCTNDSCKPGEGCVNEFNEEPCDDGNLCTSDDHCVDGMCIGTRLPECGCIVNSDCEAFEDGNPCNGKLRCQGGRCVIDPATVIKCSDPIGKPCMRSACNPETGRCSTHALEDGRPCADDSSCTYDEYCQGGECIGTEIPCNDNNLCTDDYCDQYGGCFHAYNTAACEDGNPCTINDHCQTGTCIAGGPRDCDDNKPCTLDKCSPASGCYSTPITEPGIACVADDPCIPVATCENGLCIGERRDCEDGDPCTDNYCDSADGLCKKRNNSSPCEDGNLCTVNDYCSAGVCKSGTNRDCSDTDPCTADRCVLGVGCVNEAITGCQHCPSGLDSECESPYLCKVGVCDMGSDPLGRCIWVTDPCDDGNPCTTGVCNEWNGVCSFNPVTGPCNDGNPCTTGDTCNVSTMQCIGTPVQCNDGDPCTDDYCDTGDGSCRTNWNTASCNDGDPCTENDTCNLGACAGTEKTCEDGDPCTDNYCDPITGFCHSTINAADCEDGNPCTVGDYCDLGSCLTGNPKNCSDGNECTTDSCRESDGECLHSPTAGIPCGASNKCILSGTCTSEGTCNATYKVCNDNNPCTNDSCNPSTGICVYVPNTLPCNDGNACTIDDKCFNAVCSGTTINCNDNIACTTDTCDTAIGCLFNPVNSRCDDGNECTTDSCNAQTGCVNTPLPDSPAVQCDDDNPCTLIDTCVQGQCLGTMKDCADTLKCTKDFCDTATGLCVNEYFVGPCDDANPCTTNDTCNINGVCSGTTVVCNDSIACTTDYCQSGVGCVYQPVNSACEDSNVCTTNTCVPGVGCVFAPVTTPVSCDDGNLCTTGDICSTVTGTCSGTQKNCDDGNVCTTDSCNKSTGQCGYAPTSGPCNDNIACTLEDTCISGVCYGTPTDSVCDDSSACTRDVCSLTDKKCVYTWSGASSCDDLDPCTENDVCVDVLCSGAVNCALPGCSDDPRCMN